MSTPAATFVGLAMALEERGPRAEGPRMGRRGSQARASNARATRCNQPTNQIKPTKQPSNQATKQPSKQPTNQATNTSGNQATKTSGNPEKVPRAGLFESFRLGGATYIGHSTVAYGKRSTKAAQARPMESQSRRTSAPRRWLLWVTGKLGSIPIPFWCKPSG